jgi:hypothetical protein
MCPCLSSKSEYATCSRSKDGLMAPSLYERENYCLDLYELCPLFYNSRVGIEEPSDSDCLNPVNV